MTHVTHEQAGMLEKLGMEIEYRNGYFQRYIVPPTTHQVTDFFRHVKGLHIEIGCSISFNQWYYGIQVKDGDWVGMNGKQRPYDTHAAALSAAIDTALKILKDKA